MAFQSARKDFGQAVQQAQKELTKLTAEPSGASSSSTSATDASQLEAPSSSSHGTLHTEEPKEDDSEEGDSESDNESTSSTIAPTTSTNAGFSAQSIFTRLQSSIPPNLVSTVQSNIPPSIMHATSGSVDFSQLRNTLTTEFTRVQDITRAQAEEYVHKSEELLREAGEFLKDAVKVVPPESQGESVGVVWDGSDVWMLPAIAASIASERTPGAGTSGTERSSLEGTRAVATRAEELLRRLRHDDTVIKADPEGEETVRALFDEWVSNYVESVGGIGGDEWLGKRKSALDAEGVPGLKDSVGMSGLFIRCRAELTTVDVPLCLAVPSVMAEEVFWTRYFFRVHQIEREAERRRALLQGEFLVGHNPLAVLIDRLGTSDSEDAFSWEDDDEESSSVPVPNKPSQKPTHSPRESSEESFDVVSGRNSGENVQKDVKPAVTAEEGAEADEDSDNGDSDWE